MKPFIKIVLASAAPAAALLAGTVIAADGTATAPASQPSTQPATQPTPPATQPAAPVIIAGMRG